MAREPWLTVGARFGRLTVTTLRAEKHDHIYLHLLTCDCGNTVLRSCAHLIRNKRSGVAYCAKDCPLLVQDRTDALKTLFQPGQRIGHLTLLQINVSYEYRSRLHQLRCDCGVVILRSTAHLNEDIAKHTGYCSKQCPLYRQDGSARQSLMKPQITPPVCLEPILKPIQPPAPRLEKTVVGGHPVPPTSKLVTKLPTLSNRTSLMPEAPLKTTIKLKDRYQVKTGEVIDEIEHPVEIIRLKWRKSCPPAVCESRDDLPGYLIWEEGYGWLPCTVEEAAHLPNLPIQVESSDEGIEDTRLSYEGRVAAGPISARK